MIMQRKQTSIKRRKANGIFNERRILLPYFASLIRALKQLVIPAKFRKLVLQTGHDSMFAGHFCRLKRYHIKSQFYWTGIISIVREYVQSYHVCQKMAALMFRNLLLLFYQFRKLLSILSSRSIHPPLEVTVSLSQLLMHVFVGLKNYH